MAGLAGYDFKLHRWSEAFWVNFDTPNAHLDRKHFVSTFTVPDGMWVMRQLFGAAYPRESMVLGHPETLNLGRERLRGWDDTLLFSSDPFAVINLVYEDDGQGRMIGEPHGAYLDRARQINKGELGQYVPANLPLVARDLWPRGSNRNRKRGDGWVRLVDAAEQAKMSVSEFVLDHWLFVEVRDRSYYAPEFRGVRIDMVYAPRREMIHKQVVDSARKLSYTRAEFEVMLSIGHDWSHYWIRRGFARTVLLLQQFGWNKSKEEILFGEPQAA